LGSGGVTRDELRVPEHAELICTLLHDGMSLNKIGKMIGTSESMIRLWDREDEEFHAKYARARDGWAEAIAEQLIDLADAAREDDPALTNAYRLALDTRKWVLSKVLPKKYGDRLDVEHSGTVTVVPVDYSQAVLEEDPKLKLLDLEPTEFEETESAV
jgi:hypothetical protein